MKKFQSESNVVPIRQTLPTDLMSLSKLAKKYHFSYDYLYKLVKRDRELPYYEAGSIKVSEAVFIDWANSKFVDREGA